MHNSDIDTFANAPWWPRCRCVLLLALVLGAGNAAADALVLSTTARGFIGVGAGSSNTGPSPGYGINLHSDQPSTPTGGSYVTPSTPTNYDFAAAGNSHSLSAGVPDWDLATGKLKAEFAPAGSGGSGLAVNHLQLDLWVGDTVGYGKSAGASLSTTSLLSKAVPTGVYGALHWEVTAFPDSLANSNTKLDLDLRLWEQAALLSVPLTNASGDYAKSYPGMYAGSDYFAGEFVAIAGASNGGCGSCPSPGGRFLFDVWWAYSDTPIDPKTLARGPDPLPVPEPQSWTLVMGGLALVGMLASRRRRGA